MANAKGKRTIGAEADEDLIRAVDDRARDEGRSRSEVIVRAIRFFLKYSRVQPSDEPPELDGRARPKTERVVK